MNSELEKKITLACHRIEELYYQTEGHCYVSFSGGKDSTVLLALVKMCEEVYTIPPNAIPAVFAHTGIELGITVEFVKWIKENYYPNVQVIHPEKSFDWVLKNHGKPIKSKIKDEFLMRFKTQRRTPNVMTNFVYGVTNEGKVAGRTKLADKDFHLLDDSFPIMPSNQCCDYMKKKPFVKYNKANNMQGFIAGIRINEGGIRALNFERRKKDGERICEFKSHGITQKAPIIDWSDQDVEDFIKEYNVPLSKAYTEYGFDRTGCMACPYSRNLKHDLKYLHDHEPNRYKASMYWLKDVYIAKGIDLPFDEEYEKERKEKWDSEYHRMRKEMLEKYRPDSRLLRRYYAERKGLG